MSKYRTVKINGIITRIAKDTDTPGYTEGVLEAFLPDDDNMSINQTKQWVKENNNRMKRICEFMNENNL